VSLTIRADLSGLNNLLDELGDKVEAAVRPASQAAAQVLYDEVKGNVAKIGKKTGNLANSIYQVYSERESQPGRAVYHVSWNAKKAPHGHLVEFGHLQRYKYYQDASGKVRPMVRPEAKDEPRPGRRASQATKDAYYVTLPTPKQVAARPFMRPAAAKFDKAMAAARAELLKRLDGKA
jgi:HK97 gp10 family phage protein